MPQSLRARATPLEPQANRRRSDWSSPDRRRRRRCRRSLLTLIGDRSSLHRLVTASAASAFRPPCSAAPMLPPSRYFIFYFTKLTSLSFSL